MEGAALAAPAPSEASDRAGDASPPALALSAAEPACPESDRADRQSDRPARCVLVVGMGDEERGDQGVGVQLMHCLSHLDWPAGVAFCPADASVPARAEDFARVILLDAVDGPKEPGALYRVDPGALLDRSIGGAEAGVGLLTLMSPTVRKRLEIFGIQPHSTAWGQSLSGEVASNLPVLVPYLRAMILRAAAEAARIQ